MSGPTEPGGWLAWILAGMSIAGGLYALGKRIFNTVTRSELTKIIEAKDKKFLEALQAQRDEFHRIFDAAEERQDIRHQENRETTTDIFERMTDVEKGVSRIEGQLSGRFQRSDHRPY